jgi:hypothetical protein
MAAASIVSGCLSRLDSTSKSAELSEVEVWNSDTSSHTFQVSMFDVNGDETYRDSVELGSASGNRVTRKVLSDAPDTAARVRAIVADQTDELKLEGYETPVQLSIKYNAEQQLEIVDFV